MRAMAEVQQEPVEMPAEEQRAHETGEGAPEAAGAMARPRRRQSASRPTH